MTFGGFYHRRRVLVTGSTGFKGAWLCRWLLALGAEVEGYALPPPTTPSAWEALGLAAQVRQTTADVRDLASLHALCQRFRPEVVFHLAAQALVRDSYADPKATFDINVGGTVNCLEAVRLQPSVRSCVIVTTDKCYENREWVWGYRETDHLGGHDPYSASKGACEIAVASYRLSFLHAKGAAVASARAGNVIGGGDWAKDRLVCDLVRAIGAGQPLSLRSPRATRPWQHVLEPSSAYLQLGWMLAQDQGHRWAEAWNFGPDDDAVIPVERLARALVARWGVGSVESHPDKSLHEATLLKLDVSKAHARLGWRAAWTVDEAIAATVDWYKAHGEGGEVRALTAAQIAAYTERAGARGLSWCRDPKTEP